MVLQVQAARDQSPPSVVSCTTISPAHAFSCIGPHIPVGIFHCTAVLVAAAVAADQTVHSLAVVGFHPEEVDSLYIVACLEISECS